MLTINNLTETEIKSIVDIRVNAYADKLANAIISYADENLIRCDYNHDEIVDEIKEIVNSGEWESAREVSAMTHEDESEEKVAEAENFDLVQAIVDGKLPVFGDGIVDATKEDPIRHPIMVCLETAISDVVFG
jgi:hypothetical protein